ncbi:TetR/AcrR family transcriptional regulator [Lacticaseibacillus mingshuiensis]|uniref:TetR/AcrR family transcriptional regulator n=1 Tax=Lacticaseibacillus mingshuiensis TaxID=2799574 RepID=UPI0036D22F58
MKLYEQQHLLDDMTEKQKRVLSAAIDVFAEKGYANSSTKEIAARAGVAEGNIFNRFTNKRGLLEAIVNPVIDQIFPFTLRDLIDNQLSKNNQTLADFIDGIIRDRLAFVIENARVVKIFIGELFYHEEMRDLLMKSLPKPYWDRVRDELRILQALGEMVPWDPQEVLRLIWSTVGGAAIGYLFFDQALTETAISHTVEALIKQLRP